MDLIYLDYNCFQRGFDDLGQVKIQLEAVSCEEIFSLAVNGKIRLAWSFMHEDENLVCPFIDRMVEVYRLSLYCEERIGPDMEIYSMAKSIQEKSRISSKDAVHLACAIHSKSRFFLTCDERLLKGANKLDLEIAALGEYIRGRL